MNTVQALWLMIGMMLVVFSIGWVGALRWALPEAVSAHRCLAGFNLFSGIGLTLVALRGTVDYTLSHGVSSVFHVAAFVLLWRGAEMLLNRGVAMTTRPQIAVFVLGAAVTLWFGRDPAHSHLRADTLLLIISLICGFNGWRAWRLRRKRRMKAAIVLVAVGWCVSLALLWSGISSLLGGPSAEFDYNAANNWWMAYLMLVAGYLMNIVFIYVLVARVVRRLDRLSRRDTLTGLLNRRALFDGLSAEWSRFRRRDAVFTLLCLDVDHFKSINDSFGHPAGDAVLVGLSRILTDTLRQSDLCGRTGGEEFMIVLRDIGEADAIGIAERLRETVAGSTVLRPSIERAVTISIGLAATTERDASQDALIARADAALYRAKARGRDQVCVAHPDPVAAG